MILFLNSVGKTKDELLRGSSWQLLLLNANYTNLDILPFQAHPSGGTALSDSPIQKSSVALSSSRAKPKLFIQASPALPDLVLISYSSCGPRILAVGLLYCFQKYHILSLFCVSLALAHIGSANSALLTLTSPTCATQRQSPGEVPARLSTT